MKSKEHIECSEKIRALKERLKRLKKMRKSKRKHLSREELSVQISNCESDIIRYQEILKVIIKDDEAIRNSSAQKWRQYEKKQRSQKKAAIENDHKLSKIRSQKITLVQGGSPGLGKKR